MGAFELGDQVGHDVTLHVLEYMHEVLGEPYAPCPLLEEKVENEELGKKTGKGFYDYEDGDGADIPADAGSEAVEHRLLAVMANEVAKLLADDVAPVADIDEAVVLGGGYPDGPAKLADDAGLETLVETLDELHERTGAERYAVDDALREAAEAGGFYAGEEDDGDELELETVRIEDPGEQVGKLVIDRPHRMNTISPQVMDDLEVAIERLEDDDEVRAILLVGEGDRAFCAGADVQATAANAEPIEAVEFSRKGQQTFGKLEECPMPVVAGIDGYTLGGGMELATCADLRIASERSTFGQPEHDLGILPGWGGTQRLQRIVGMGRAKEIIFTAEHYDAETMYDYGFVNEVVDTDDIEERAFELATDMAAGPPIAQRYTKRAMHVGWEDVDAGLEAEANAFGHVVGTDDVMEGVRAFMADEEPEFEGK
jgi:enoyl-CoA hydratase/3-hydroxyacyl-CoA dehydrogenase